MLNKQPKTNKYTLHCLRCLVLFTEKKQINKTFTFCPVCNHIHYIIKEHHN